MRTRHLTTGVTMSLRATLPPQQPAQGTNAFKLCPLNSKDQYFGELLGHPSSNKTTQDIVNNIILTEMAL